MNKEILWNIVNSLLAGALVFVGAFSSGNISAETLCIAVVAGLSVAIIQFKNYWGKEEAEYSNKTLGTFI